MSIWKKIVANLILLGFLLTLSACVVTRSPGYYPPPHLHTTLWWYYPDYQVYYHSTDHYYYYFDSGAWVRATTLPWRITLSDQRRVRIDVNGLPYVNHSRHLRRYPPARSNHRDRDDHRHRPDDDRRNGPGDDHRHRPSDDRKEGTNIFKPHLKDKRYDDKQYSDKRDKLKGNRLPSKTNRQKFIEKTRKGEPVEEKDSRKRLKVEKQNKKEKVKDNRKSKTYYKGNGKGKGKQKPDDGSRRKGDYEEEYDESDEREPRKKEKVTPFYRR